MFTKFYADNKSPKVTLAMFNNDESIRTVIDDIHNRYNTGQPFFTKE